jgi:hypothetical protein
MGGQPGNRQDNRQRGNAAQLLEKYKSMARDAQLAGDRVQTEYYLQFADHYFRVLSENRARFEEQNPRRQRDDEDEDEGDEELMEGDDGGEERPERPEPRPERQERLDRGPRQDRGDRFNRERRPRREERAARDNDEDGEGGRVNGGGETIPFDALPPAIGRDDSETVDVADEKPRRPRRTRATRPAEGDEEIAPAA